jgi:hypothetical protein
MKDNGGIDYGTGTKERNGGGGGGGEGGMEGGEGVAGRVSLQG